MAQSSCWCFHCEEVEAKVAMKRAASFDLRVGAASCCSSQVGYVLTPFKARQRLQFLFSD